MNETSVNVKLPVECYNSDGQLRLVGRDIDKVIQAIEGTGKQSIIGVQWHQESLCYPPSQLNLFCWLVRSDS